MKKLEKKPQSKKLISLNKQNFNATVKSGLILIDFWAPWCAPCKMIAPILSDLAESESHRIKIAKVNVEYEKQLASKFNIRNIPTMVIMKNGVEVKRLVGMKTKKMILKEINEIN
ncbi:MAG: thioredoxin [Bacteroidales bacterium]|nr:thioredoxin [Bacteroidales bacterium]